VFFLGKAVPKQLKFRAEVLLENHKAGFSLDFKKNRDYLVSLDLPLSKTNRNIVAGYITRMFSAKE